MVAAQKTAAMRAGCDVIDDVVKRITPIGSEGYEIEAERSGQRIRTQKVLLATGSFTESRDLLPKDLKPLVNPSSVTVLLVRIHSEHPVVNFSKTLPAIVVKWNCSSGRDKRTTVVIGESISFR